MSVHIVSLSLETIDTCLRALGELPLKASIQAFNELVAQRQIATAPEIPPDDLGKPASGGNNG
jgi:hypothetical protein